MSQENILIQKNITRTTERDHFRLKYPIMHAILFLENKLWKDIIALVSCNRGNRPKNYGNGVVRLTREE